MNEGGRHLENNSNTLVDSAYNILLKRIVSIEYAPGTVLNEQGLVGELNISRTPIHAACIRLSQDGLIEFLPKKGLRITEIDADFIRDLHDTRDLIEPYAVENFGRDIPKDLLLNYLHIFENPDSPRELLFRTDLDMHMATVLQTKNRLLCNYYKGISHHIERISTVCGEYTPGRLIESNQEHIDFLLALLQDDIPAATASIRDHLKKARASAYHAAIIDNPNRNS